MARIFLCHANEDKAQVRMVYHQLKALGFAPWLDEVDILPGQDWNYEIERALEASDFVIVFLSTRSVKKVGYVQREFQRALFHAEEMPEGFIHTIPVKLDACLVPHRFSRHHWVNLYENDAFELVVRALHYGLQQRGHSEPLTHDPPSQLEDESGKTWTNSIGMEFVLIPAGTFMMGSPYLDAEADENEKPAHRVTISRPFHMGKCLVTQGQWAAVIGSNPSEYRHNPNHPVESVSWDDVQTFLHKLNEHEGRGDYRLPTEAQWEYACRAGTHTPRYHSEIDAIAWYLGNSNNQTQPAGQKLPNAWGLCDMLGNVWEWCRDGARTYAADTAIDPMGPTRADTLRVVRGGGWYDSARVVRAAYRHVVTSGFRNDTLGFRCACSGSRR